MASPSLKDPIPGAFLNPSAAPQPLPSFPHCWDFVSPPGERRSTGSLLGPPGDAAARSLGILMDCSSRVSADTAPLPLPGWVTNRKGPRDTHGRRRCGGVSSALRKSLAASLSIAAAGSLLQLAQCEAKRDLCPRTGEFINHRWLAQPSSHQSQAGSAHRGSLWTCPSSSEVFHSAGTKPPRK